MYRVYISRWLNHRLFGGNPNMMISTRVYVQDRRFWVTVIDLIFWLIRGEVEHCRNCFYFDLAQKEVKDESDRV